MKLKPLTLILAAAAVSTAHAEYTGPKVEITYLHGFTGPDRPIMEQLVKKFNESHPNIEVKATAQPWGTTWQQLRSSPVVAPQTWWSSTKTRSPGSSPVVRSPP